MLDARNEHGLIQVRKREDREHEDEDDGGAGPGGPGRGRRAPHHGEVHLRCREGLAQPASEEGALETLGGEADEKASARRVMKYGEGKWQRLRRGSRPGSDMHSRTKTLANAWIHSPPDRAHASPSRPPLRKLQPRCDPGKPRRGPIWNARQVQALWRPIIGYIDKIRVRTSRYYLIRCTPRPFRCYPWAATITGFSLLSCEIVSSDSCRCAFTSSGDVSASHCVGGTKSAREHLRGANAEHTWLRLMSLNTSIESMA